VRAAFAAGQNEQRQTTGVKMLGKAGKCEQETRQKQKQKHHQQDERKLPRRPQTFLNKKKLGMHDGSNLSKNGGRASAAHPPADALALFGAAQAKDAASNCDFHYSKPG